MAADRQHPHHLQHLATATEINLERVADSLPELIVKDKNLCLRSRDDAIGRVIINSDLPGFGTLQQYTSLPQDTCYH